MRVHLPSDACMASMSVDSGMASHERHQRAAVAPRRVDASQRNARSRLLGVDAPLRRWRQKVSGRPTKPVANKPKPVRRTRAQSSCPQTQANAIVQSAWTASPSNVPHMTPRSACCMLDAACEGETDQRVLGVVLCVHASVRSLDRALHDRRGSRRGAYVATPLCAHP
jgi:hypothetical protein